MARYKNRDFQRLYEGLLAMAADPKSSLYLSDGAQHRGASHRCAFWDGYNGVTRSANVVPATQSSVAFAAGKAFAKIRPGVPKGGPVNPFLPNS